MQTESAAGNKGNKNRTLKGNAQRNYEAGCFGGFISHHGKRSSNCMRTTNSCAKGLAFMLIDGLIDGPRGTLL